VYVLELGGEDEAFAAAEARAAATDVRVAGHGVALAADIDPARVRSLAYTHRAGEFVDEVAGTVEAATVAAREMALDREGSVAVRARDVRGATGVDTQAAEREVGAALVDRGFSVDLDDPDHEFRVLFVGAAPRVRKSQSDFRSPSEPNAGSEDAAESASGERVPDRSAGTGRRTVAGENREHGGPRAGDRCFLAWLTVESVRDYGDRKPTDRPFFQPGSMDPLLARAVCNLARVDPGDRVLDPMCGTGGVLIEAGLLGARPLGTDAQSKMVRGARQNLAHFLDNFDVARADATSLPLRGDSVDADEPRSPGQQVKPVDAAVFDAPYGRQSKIETHDLADLVGGALADVRRVTDGRCVLVADRDWRDEAEDAGWTVADRFERRVHRSLTRYVLVLE
jgi:tRNA (guanine10-N2)-dimethyltransferase